MPRWSAAAGSRGPVKSALPTRACCFSTSCLEFSRHVLEVLRQPLEEGCVAIARAARTVVFPARFVLVAAMNPCPCGFAGDPVHACRCTPLQAARYRGRLSGPLRDRLDLTVEVPALPPGSLGRAADGESSAIVRSRVIAARERQRLRYADDGIRTNRELTPRLAAVHCVLDGAAGRVLDRAVLRLGLTARGFDRVRKVARTIADLADADRMSADHVAEALQFRMT